MSPYVRVWTAQIILYMSLKEDTKLGGSEKRGVDVEGVGEDMNMIKIYHAEFSKNF